MIWQEVACVLIVKIQSARTVVGLTVAMKTLKKLRSAKIMNKDLISREWIRKMVEEYRLKQAYDARDEMRNTMVDWIEEDIDSAPIVEVYTEEDMLNATSNGYDIARRLYERPQGEWILIDDVDDPEDRLNRYKCSECGRIIKIYDHQTLADYPFCHCGADMRGNKK